jgi:hypothetical protein
MISLKNYGIVLGCPATGAMRLKLGSEISKVDALAIDAFNDCRGLAPLSHFQPDLYRLLFHANSAANAEILWEAAGRTNVRHLGV